MKPTYIIQIYKQDKRLSHKEPARLQKNRNHISVSNFLFKGFLATYIFLHIVLILIQPAHTSPGAGGKETGMLAELSSLVTS